MRKTKNSLAVSEVIGFFLILGIMVTGIGLITLYGYPILLEQQNNANVRNMERNMIVLQADINALTYKSVPYKETTMQVGGSSLTVIPPQMSNAYLEVTGTILPVEKFYPGQIRYELGDAVVSLENGAVLKRYWSDQTGSVMLSDPRWYIDDNPTTNERTLVINLINVTTEPTNGAPQTLSKIGIATIRSTVNISAQPFEEKYPSPGRAISIKYQKDPEYDYKYAWYVDYFGKLAQEYNDPGGYGGVDTTNGDTLNVHGVNRLIIKKSEISILGM